MELFQVTNVLSKEDFDELIEIKDILIKQKNGLVISEDNNHTAKNLHIDWNATFSLKKDIDSFSISYPPVVIKLLYTIQNAFKERGSTNAYPLDCRMYRKNSVTAWHKHSPINFDNTIRYPKNKWYCVIYYMHPNWDTSYNGQLKVSKISTIPGTLFDCFSNSFVAHNGYYGHAVEEIKKGYEGNRDIFLTHWMTE